MGIFSYKTTPIRYLFFNLQILVFVISILTLVS
jgi:hypothetical protein